MKIACMDQDLLGTSGLGQLIATLHRPIWNFWWRARINVWFQGNLIKPGSEKAINTSYLAFFLAFDLALNHPHIGQIFKALFWSDFPIHFGHLFWGLKMSHEETREICDNFVESPQSIESCTLSCIISLCEAHHSNFLSAGQPRTFGLLRSLSK